MSIRLNEAIALSGVAQLVGIVLQSKGSLVQFQTWAQAWVTGPVTGPGAYMKQLIDVSLSYQCFSPSVFPSLYF